MTKFNIEILAFNKENSKIENVCQRINSTLKYFPMISKQNLRSLLFTFTVTAVISKIEHILSEEQEK